MTLPRILATATCIAATLTAASAHATPTCPWWAWFLVPPFGTGVCVTGEYVDIIVMDGERGF